MVDCRVPSGVHHYVHVFQIYVIEDCRILRLVTDLSSLKSNNDPPGFFRGIFLLPIAKQKLLPDEPLQCRIASFYTLPAKKLWILFPYRLKTFPRRLEARVA